MGVEMMSITLAWCPGNDPRLGTRAGAIRDDPDQKLESYKRGALAREARRRQETTRRRKAGWATAERAACLLKETFGATRVIVFGSLVHGVWFRPDSDIDLAVAGIPPEVFWRAWCALDRISEGFEINLVALEDASGSLRCAIEMEGREL